MDYGVVIGFKKSFDYIDFETMQLTRLIDVTNNVKGMKGIM
jgi:hypothetical protein